jgi:general secretion pathway protein D
VDFDLAINALQTRGDVKLLALPVLIAQNNREASLNVGSNVPFVQVSQTGGFDPLARVQTVQYLPVGKQLTITPTINADGYVNMDVVQTNDDVTNNLLFDAPIISQRQAQTSVFVRDGQTTVIGGLSDNTTEASTAGVPFLSRIPWIGALFGNTRRSTRTTELYLFLTPHIVSSDEDVDRLRESVRSGSELLRDLPVEGRLGPKGNSAPPRPPVRPDTLPSRR